MMNNNEIELPALPSEEPEELVIYQKIMAYLLDMDCSEGQPGRYVIYYDDDTERSAKFEANCIADGFTFKRDE